MNERGPLTIRVEDAGNANINTVLAMETISQCLRDTLAFVVTGTGANGVHMSPAAKS